MGFRGCRIAVGGVGVFILFVAFSLTLAAIFTPQWQVAGLEQVNQVRFIGLYQTCAYGSRQGPMSPPQWICTFIPYGHRNQFMFGSAAVNGFHGPVVTGQGSENDHTANGGEAWRLATLILLVFAAFLGFLAFVAALIEICLDSARSTSCLKGASCCSLVTLILATLCCMIGVLVFAINSQQNHNLYVLELTAFAIFQLGQSFYIGISALVMFFIALAINIGGTALVCISARNEDEGVSYRQRGFQAVKPRLYASSNNNKPIQKSLGGETNEAFYPKPKVVEASNGAGIIPTKSMTEHDRSLSYATQFPGMISSQPDRSPGAHSKVSSGSVYTVTAC